MHAHEDAHGLVAAVQQQTQGTLLTSKHICKQSWILNTFKNLALHAFYVARNALGCM